MQQSRRSVSFCFCHRRKQSVTASSTAGRVGKWRLCVASRLVRLAHSFDGRELRAVRRREEETPLATILWSDGLSIRAWCYAAWSKTTTMRLPCRRCRSVWRTKASSVSPLKTGRNEVTKRPVLRLTSPTTRTRRSGGSAWYRKNPSCHGYRRSRHHPARQAGEVLLHGRFGQRAGAGDGARKGRAHRQQPATAGPGGPG
jgi:hypothetical protein